MTAINNLLASNEKFVSEKRFAAFRADKHPAKKITMLACYVMGMEIGQLTLLDN